MIERKIIRSVAALMLAAACSAPESTKTPVPTRVPTATTLYIPPTEIPSPTDTQTPQPTNTITPTATLIRSMNSTPDSRVPVSCGFKPYVSPEMLDQLSKTEIFFCNRSRKVMLLTYDDL